MDDPVPNLTHTPHTSLLPPGSALDKISQVPRAVAVLILVAVVVLGVHRHGVSGLAGPAAAVSQPLS